MPTCVIFQINCVNRPIIIRRFSNFSGLVSVIGTIQCDCVYVWFPNSLDSAVHITHSHNATRNSCPLVFAICDNPTCKVITNSCWSWECVCCLICHSSRFRGHSRVIVKISTISINRQVITVDCP